jgi:hypothetical protein
MIDKHKTGFTNKNEKLNICMILILASAKITLLVDNETGLYIDLDFRNSKVLKVFKI